MLFLGVLFSSVRRGEFTGVLSRVDPLFVVLSFLLVVVMIPSSCLKWSVLLGQHARTLPFRDLLRIYLVGYFFSNMLPSNVGGDVVRSFYVGRRIKSQSDAAASTFVERFTGVLLLLVLAMTAPLLQPGLYRTPHVSITAAAAACLLAGLIWVWKVPAPLVLPDRLVRGALSGMRRCTLAVGFRAGNRLVDRLLRGYESLFRKVERFHEKLLLAAAYLQANPRPLWGVVALTVFFYVMTWVNVYVGFRAFGVKPGFLPVCAIVPSVMLVAMLPVSLLGNLGFTEGVYVVFFSLIGIDQAAALSMGLLLRLKLLAVGVTGFVVYLTIRDSEGDPAGLGQADVEPEPSKPRVTP